jgi:hypothetical protein
LGRVGSIEPKWSGEVHQATEILQVPIVERIGSLGIEEHRLLVEFPAKIEGDYLFRMGRSLQVERILLLCLDRVWIVDWYLF